MGIKIIEMNNLDPSFFPEFFKHLRENHLGHPQVRPLLVLASALAS